jgi:gluconate 2-dehydrogenase gamma chain
VQQITPGNQPRGLSRKDLLKRAGIVGAAAAVPTGFLAREASSQPTVSSQREALEALTPTETDALDAFVDRLIPEDALGPGAVSAGVPSFIDRSLAGALAANLSQYQNGLAALDALAQSSYGSTFAKLTNAQRDALITQLAANTAKGFSPDSRTFFTLVREHTLQGMFGDPYYGGNKNDAGWKLMGFPGIGLDIKAADQRTGVTSYVSKYQKSTYDWAEFKRGARKVASHDH